jgi:hypothetical protein
MLRPTKGMGHPSPPPSLATLRFGQASDGGSEGMAQPDPMINFAELDARNSQPAILAADRRIMTRPTGLQIS